MRKALEFSRRPGPKTRIASDQALGVLFQKILDPESVVRESEYARTPEGSSLLSKIRAIPEHILKGGLALTDEERKALVEIATEVVNADKRSVNELIDNYTELSKQYGIRPKLVLGTVEKFKIKEKKSAEQSMSFGQLFEKYKDVLGNLNQNQMNIIDKAWQEAVKDDVPAQEFVNEWLKLRKGLK